MDFLLLYIICVEVELLCLTCITESKVLAIALVLQLITLITSFKFSRIFFLLFLFFLSVALWQSLQIEMEKQQSETSSCTFGMVDLYSQNYTAVKMTECMECINSSLLH